jgi:hypothetical protein
MNVLPDAAELPDDMYELLIQPEKVSTVILTGQRQEDLYRWTLTI